MERRTILLVSAGAEMAAALLTTALVAAPAIRQDTAAASASNQVLSPSSTTSPSTDTPQPPPSPPNSTTTSAPPETLSAAERTKLTDAVNQAVATASPGTDISFAIYDRELGNDPVDENADKPFYTASVVKLLIAIDELHSIDWQTPDPQTAANPTEMLSGSNDDIADQFWDDDGGNDIVTRMAALIGLSHTTPPTIPGQWGMTLTSASDVVTIYQYIEHDMPSAASKSIMDALAAAKNPADDGFDQYFGIPDGLPGAPWAIKQGWMVLDSSLVLNTTGVVGADNRYVTVLLTAQPASTSYAQGRTAVTAGITAMAPALTIATKTS
jgi:hypothetical protein